MQTVYLRNTSDNREPGSNMAQKNSLVFLSADLSVPPFIWKIRIAYAGLKGFRVSLRSRSVEIQPCNYFTFRTRVLHGKIERLLCILSF